MYWLYRNNRNPNKFIELKRYPDGHYVWKQYIVSMFGKNYVGTTIKQCKKGVWHRVTKRTFIKVLEDYRLVDVLQWRYKNDNSSVNHFGSTRVISEN